MRSKGVGEALYKQVMQFAKQSNVKRVEWVVLDWNTGAIRFYERTGATVFKNWHIVQMKEEGINAYLENN